MVDLLKRCSQPSMLVDLQMTLKVINAALQSGQVRSANPASRRPSPPLYARVTARLLPETIKAIHDEYEAGTRSKDSVTHKALAKKYGISQKSVQRILRGQR